MEAVPDTELAWGLCVPWDIRIQVKQRRQLVLVPCVGGEEGRVYIIQLSCRALHHSCPSQEKFVFVPSPPPPPFCRENLRKHLGLLPLVLSSPSAKSTFLQRLQIQWPSPELWGQGRELGSEHGEASACPRRKALQRGSACPGLCRSRTPCEHLGNHPCWQLLLHTNSTTERTK